MTRNLERALAGCVLVLHTLSHRPVAGQSGEVAPFLSVRRGHDRCLRAGKVAAQVGAFVQNTPAADVRIELDPGPPARFTVLRGDQVLGERVFDTLPLHCKARRKAVAFSMALSLESFGLAQLSTRPVFPTSDAVETRHPDGLRAAILSPARAEPTPPTTDDETRSAKVTPPATAVPPTSTQPQAIQPDQTRAPIRADPPPVRPSAPTQGPSSTDPAWTRTTPRAQDPNPGDTPQGTALAFGFSVGGGMMLQVQPGPTPELHLATELAVEPLAFELAILWSPPIERNWTLVASSAVRTEAAGGRLSACLGDALAHVRLEGCGGLMAAALLASGRGFTRDSHDAAMLLALTVGLRARFPPNSPWAVRLRVDAQPNLVRPELRVAGGAPSATSLGVVGAAGIIELHFLTR